METLMNCLTDGGILSCSRLFIKLFNSIPNTYSLTFNEDTDACDLLNITDELLKKLFNGVTSITRRFNRYTNPNMQDSEEECKFLLSASGSDITIVTAKEIYLIDLNSITVRYSNSNCDWETELKNIWKELPKKQIIQKEAVVELVGYSDGNYYTIESKIKQVNINISENYNDDFAPVYKDVINFLDSRESGLILFYGAPGTGKTSVIRHLCNKYPRNYIVVPTSLTNRLGDPDFISFMLDNSNSVFILEDCEQVLMDRGINMFNGAISNILNMSDGLLSDIMNVKFICTFNADIKAIDSALLRKGRCYARYEFKELSEDKVKNLSEKYNLSISDIRPMTLAEIYNADKTEYFEKSKYKIGI